MRISAAMTAERILPRRLAARALPHLKTFDALVFGTGERSHAARMSMTAFAVRIASAAIAFASQVFLARWMGAFEYGVFALVWTAILILGNLSGFGFHTAIIRFIPEYRSQQRWSDLRGVIFASRFAVVATSTVVALAGALLVHLLSARIEPYYILPFLLGMVCLPMMALSDLMHGVARGHGWQFHAMLPTYIFRPGLIIVLMIAAIIAGAPPTAVTGMYAAIAATYLTCLWQLVVVSGNSARAIPAAPRGYAMRKWTLVSLPIFVIEGFIYIVTNADVLLVGFFLPPTDVAVYFATVKTLALVHFVYFAVKAGVAQRFAGLMHGDDRHELGAFARDTVRWTFWPTLAMGILLLIVGEPLLWLFGTEFTAGYPLLFVLVAGVLARSTVGPAESLLSMSGYQNACAVVFAIVLALNVGLSCFLIPLYGLWGAAFATALAMVCEAAMLAFTVRRKLGIDMWMGAAAPATGGAL
ncbi:lipopolysaccharide biosynthesis protein [Aliihoeflea sp. PC F10.4]